MEPIGSGTLGTLFGNGISWVKDSYSKWPAMHLHEIGHNLNLHHAGLGDNEYADKSSAMGYCCAPRCYHFVHSWQLGFASYKAEIDISTLEAASTSTSVSLPELGRTKECGLKMTRGDGKTLVVSYRGRGGFDSLLSRGPDGGFGLSRWSNSVHVHLWPGSKKTDHIQTDLVLEAKPGDTMAIPDTSLKLTFKFRSDNAAEVLLCKNDNQMGNAAASECTADTTTPTQPPPTPRTTSTTPAPTPTTTPELPPCPLCGKRKSVKNRCNANRWKNQCHNSYVQRNTNENIVIECTWRKWNKKCKNGGSIWLGNGGICGTAPFEEETVCGRRLSAPGANQMILI